jgi:polysaccharide export outer membrane protein
MRINRFVSLTGHAALRLSIAFFLVGCTWLPQDGPDKTDLLQVAAKEKGVVVVELTPTAVSAIHQATPETFSGSFPPYHPAGQQVIGVGDTIQITLWEAGDGGLFSSPPVNGTTPGSRTATIPDQVVARDGAITVPYAGRIRVVGMTPPQVETIIVSRLEGLATKPQALVTVTHNVSNTVTVEGEVRSGRLVPLSTRGDRLLQVIAEAGGVTSPISDTVIRLTRDDRTVSIPMQVLLQRPEENVYAQPGDVVTLVRQPQEFMMFGAVPRTGEIPFDALGISLTEALAKAGGLLTQQADPDGLFVLRYERPEVVQALDDAQAVPSADTAVPVVYHLNMRAPLAMLDAQHFAIRNQDIVYVSDAPLTNVQKVLGMFSLLAAPAVTGLSAKAAF